MAVWMVVWMAEQLVVESECEMVDMMAGMKDNLTVDVLELMMVGNLVE
jgi:hypothetical protein